MIKRNVGLVGLALLLIVLIAGAAAWRHTRAGEEFLGSRVKTADAYLSDIEQMNGMDRHTMVLQRGDTLQIRFETKEGSLHMEIMAPDGAGIYQGRGKGATSFTINISESGAYTIAVEGRRARGMIHIQRTGGKE